MRKAGRQKDSVWAEFEEVATHSQNQGIRAKCKVCGKELQGLVQRLRDHKKKCKEPQRDSDLEAETIEGNYESFILYYLYMNGRVGNSEFAGVVGKWGGKRE